LKTQITQLLEDAIQSLKNKGTFTTDLAVEIVIERARDKSHGDFASNVAMRLAKPLKQKPRDIAQLIVDAMPSSAVISDVQIAGPGFINFTLAQGAVQSVVFDILQQQSQYGLSDVGKGKKVQIEFVSANPTGPLHVGHGRGAAYGSVVANLLQAVGYEVSKEYYVNDAGRQMDILACSVYLRYLELCNETVVFPSNGYKGAYIFDIAKSVFEQHASEFSVDFSSLLKNVIADETEENKNGDKEAHIDGLITNVKKHLGKTHYHVFFGAGLNSIVKDIKADLAEFGVVYDNWFSERSLMEHDAISKALEKLEKNNTLYQKDDALWFKSTEYGDEKDRVLQRDNGQTTYFASDIAYHLNKFDRGFDKCLDIWGADHHGYVPRVKGSLSAMQLDADALDVLLVQFAVLYRSGEKIQMSTRSGQFVTLRELREEVGNDAARFFYVMRRCEQHLDFDLDLAKSKSNENPVYYIQYAHARICSVFRELDEKGMVYNENNIQADLSKLANEHEQALMSILARYPGLVQSAADNYEPHQIPQYLRELANQFHTYYNAHKFIVDDEVLRNARLHLIVAVRQVIKNGLLILGVSAPEAM